MSFTQVLAELPSLTFEQRQQVIRRALELDEPVMSSAEESLVEARMAGHQADPSSSVPLEEMKQRLRSRAKS